MKWQFLNSGFASGDVNMECDEALAQHLLDGGEAGTLRVYGWNPPAISLGRNQSIECIDLAKAANDNVEVVKRATGGRAILHSEELTYSVTMLSTPKSFRAEYHMVSQSLVAGLRLLGADVNLEPTQPHFPSLYQQPSSGACYASTAQHEIKSGGKKIVGSAQRRYSRADGWEVVLQHGSILLGPDHRRLTRYLKISEEDDRQRLEDIMQNRVTDLSSVLNRRVEFAEVAEAIKTGFETTLSIEFDMSPSEITSIHQPL